MKVLFVSPKPDRPVFTGDYRDKLGLLYVAGALDSQQIPVRIIDRHVDKITDHQFFNIIREFNPQVIGFSVTTETIDDTIHCCSLIKKNFPQIKIILGGHHVSMAADDFLRHVRDVDFIIRGEADQIIPELIKIIENNSDPANLAGISYFDYAGNIIHNINQTLIADLNDLALPARQLMDKYALKKKKLYYYYERYPGSAPLKMGTCLMISSRGCPFDCAFCASSCFWQQRWRARSAEKVVEEIEILAKDFEVDFFEISDDAFTIDQNRAEKICRLLIERKLKIKWNTHLRVDSVSQDLLKLMKEAGCFYVSYGVESGSQRILDEIIGKKLKIERIIEVTHWLDELGIKRHANFMVSFPTETKVDAEATLNLMKKIGGKTNLAITVVYPGTKIEKLAREKALLPPNFTWTQPLKTEYTLPSIKQRAPFFVDTLSWEDVCHYLLEWSKMQNYDLFKHAWRSLKNIRSLADFEKILKIGLAYIKNNSAKLS